VQTSETVWKEANLNYPSNERLFRGTSMKVIGHLLILMLPAAIIFGSTNLNNSILHVAKNPLSRYDLFVNPAKIEKTLNICPLKGAPKNRENSAKPYSKSITSKDSSVILNLYSHDNSKKEFNISIYPVTGAPSPDNGQLLKAYGFANLPETFENAKILGQVVIRYSDSDVRGIAEEQLQLSKFNPKENKWETIASTVNPKTNEITGFITDNSIIGVTIDNGVHVQPCVKTI
jgi:hypothetical protein